MDINTTLCYMLTLLLLVLVLLALLVVLLSLVVLMLMLHGFTKYSTLVRTHAKTLASCSRHCHRHCALLGFMPNVENRQVSTVALTTLSLISGISSFGYSYSATNTLYHATWDCLLEYFANTLSSSGNLDSL